jgi:hypothetical protein
MSYNTDTWKTKELVNLVIPISSLFKHERTDWHPGREDKPDRKAYFTIIDSEIVGITDGDFLHVTDISICGEGSGTAWNWIVEPALKESTGRLVAVRVWEGGDSIDRLTVIDGVVTSENVDL